MNLFREVSVTKPQDDHGTRSVRKRLALYYEFESHNLTHSGCALVFVDRCPFFSSWTGVQREGLENAKGSKHETSVCVGWLGYAACRPTGAWRWCWPGGCNWQEHTCVACVWPKEGSQARDGPWTRTRTSCQTYCRSQGSGHRYQGRPRAEAYWLGRTGIHGPAGLPLRTCARTHAPRAVLTSKKGRICAGACRHDQKFSVQHAIDRHINNVRQSIVPGGEERKRSRWKLEFLRGRTCLPFSWTHPSLRGLTVDN